MRLSRFAVYHPVLTVMVALVAVLLGVISVSRLPIDLMPDITYPTLSVTTSYEGASPEEIEELVTRPIEQAMSSVPGVEEVTSVSTEGSSRIRVTFSWGSDLDAAANDIRDRLDRVVARLPEETDRPRLRKFDLASFPILILGASSNLDPVQMRKMIDDQVKYRIERVPGVAALDVWGGLDREIHVDMKPDKLKALGLSMDRVVARIRAENIEVPAGSLYRGNLDVMVRTLGSYESLDQLRHTVIDMRQGVPVLLHEVADVTDSWRKIDRTVRVNGQPGVRLSVSKQSGKNTVDVATGVLAELEKLRADFPQLNLVSLIDSSDYIQRSIRNVSSAAIFGGMLALVVLFLFLRDFRSTGIIGAAIPISVITTFALLYFCGFTLNIMTLGGLALGVGMLVDNAIVVLENTYRLRQSGMLPFDAAVEGAQEVGSAIMASTLTTLAVFLPLIFMRGMAGMMFKQLSYVVAFALACSLLVAMTIVPMLAARASHDDRPRSPQGSNAGGSASGPLFARVEAAYADLLGWALEHRAVTVLAALGLLGGSLCLVPLVGVELMPSADESEVRIDTKMEVGTRLGVVDEKTRVIEAIIADAVPETKSVVASVGGPHWRASGSHTADIRVALVPASQRSRSSDEIANIVRRKLSGIPGVTARVRPGRGLFLLRMMTRGMGSDRIQIEIRGYDLETSAELARRVKEVVESVPGVTDARLSRETGSPEELVYVDRQKAADMKLSVSKIANALQTALSGTRAGYYRDGGTEYTILAKLKEAEKLSLSDVLDLTVTNADDEPVVLRNMVGMRPRSGPVRIERADQERTVTIRAELSGRDMSSVIAEVREGLRSIPARRDFQILIGGDYEQQQKAFNELLVSLVLALALVYMVMAGLYESLLDPFIVMFSVPLAAIGVILMLFLSRTTFNIQSYIGCIMLGGIVVNNAILLVDYTNLLRTRDGLPMAEAIEEAGRRRLRPILMTALTTTLGLVPLALGLGEGGEAQAPMARAVIGGLLSSTLITLVFVPVVYSVFKRSRAAATGHGAPPGPATSS